MSEDKVLNINEYIAQIAGEAGAKVALYTIDKEKKKAAKERRDRRLRNTKLLLRNYRMLKAHCESAVYEAARMDVSEVDIIELIESVFTNGEMYVESIKRSAERTYLIMSHVNKMLRIYEIYCSTSGAIEDRRRYDALYARYIAEESMTIAEIAEKENVDNSTVYRDINTAVEKLSALLFGIDGLM